MVDVAGPRDCCAHAFADGVGDFNDVLAVVNPHAHGVARHDLLGGLDRLAADFDVPCLAGLTRSGAGLHETHRPDPHVDAHRLGTQCGWRASFLG